MSDPDKIKQVFTNYSIIIVSEDETVCRILGKAFENRGGTVQIYNNGNMALNSIDSGSVDVVVYAGMVEKGGPDWFLQQVRTQKKASVNVIWYVGDEKFNEMDGHTQRPFRPVELLRPIYSTLKSAS